MNIRIASRPATAPVSTQPAAATAQQMRVARKQAVALSKFWKTTMAGYDQQMKKPGMTQLNAIKAVFGSTARRPTPDALIGRQTLAAQFFYMSTVIDTRTGALYQSENAGPPYFGPLIPPVAARIKGNFSAAQGEELMNIVATGR